MHGPDKDRLLVMGLRHYVRSRLHRRIFAWFGLSILTTGATVWVVMSLLWPASGRDYREDWERFRGLVAHRFEVAWEDPAAREELAADVADRLRVRVELVDTDGAMLVARGPMQTCERAAFVTDVRRGSELLGTLRVCTEPTRSGGWSLLVLIGVACAVLWAASGLIARRIARPLWHVAGVARDLGQGRLGSRVRLHPKHRIGEIGVVADAIDDMASRIEKQLRDQKELLAAVSHELRTPLGHLRILLELARETTERGEKLDPKVVDELELEILEVDDLVGELLASSRLSFDTLEHRPLEALDIAARALERTGLSLDLLTSDEESIPFDGDATLLGRALANLIENAKKHGRGVKCVRIDCDETSVTFAVDDDGPGFTAGEIERVFDPFYRGEHRAGATHGSLGLGLSLVRRIAVAHGGRAWAVNREGGGARVAFRIARRAK